MIQSSEKCGLKGPFDYTGPLPHFDHCGYEVAVNMLLESRKPGRHSSEYTQFWTV